MITAKEAYAIAKDTLSEDFKIDGCTETPDGWIFGWCHKDGTAVFLPPIKIDKKTGEAEFYRNPDFKFAAIEERLDADYKHVPLNELEK